MAESDSSKDREHFIPMLINAQPRLYAYILSAVTCPNATEDVLQETNVVLWRKADEAAAADSFIAWALKVAYFQVRAHWQKQGRDRHSFDDALLQSLADKAAQDGHELSRNRAALQGCLQKLTEHQRELITERYTAGISVKQLAAKLSRPVGAISQSLYRIRAKLFDCIKQSLINTKEAS